MSLTSWSRIAPLILSLGPPTLVAQARPPLGPLVSFSAPSVHRDTLANGLAIVLVPFGTTPTARVELVVRTGRASEGPNELGLAQIVADYLLEGSSERDASAFARELSALGVVGGGFTVSVGSHETLIAGEVLAESAPVLLRLLGEMVARPALSPSSLDALKTNLRRRIEGQSTQAAVLAGTRAIAVMFPGDPADRVPTAADLARITIDNVRRFHESAFGATRARLYVAGVFDRAAVAGAAREAFASWSRGTPAPAWVAVTPPGAVAADLPPVIHLIDRPGASQSRVQVSFPTPDQAHPDHMALNVFNTVMGSVQTSRIIANVREKNGYSYNVSTRLLRRPGATQWAVQADVNRDVTGAALRAILAEIERVRTEPPSELELGGFQRFMSGGLIIENSTARGILESLEWMDLYGARPDYLSTMTQQVHAIRPNDISRVVHGYITPPRMVIVVVGDRAQIERQLQEVGRVTP